MNMEKSGFIYVLSNQAMPGLYKIGRTENRDIEVRMASLQNSGVPLPFDLEFAIKVENIEKVERLLHETFGEHRINPKREFFKIPVKRIIAALRLTGGEEIKIDRSSVEERLDEEMVSMGETNDVKRKDITTFKMLSVPIDAELIFIYDEQVKCKVVGERQVEFEGEDFYVSELALKLLRERRNWKGTVNGFWYFKYEGEVLAERRRRVERENFRED